MTRIIVVVRELGRLKVEYSLEFDVPEVPAVGAYVSIHRPDKPGPFSEDLVVRHVWWRLSHPETGGIGSDPPKTGGLTEIFVECDQALGPYANDRWRDMMKRAKERGVEVEDFQVSRLSVRESDLATSDRP